MLCNISTKQDYIKPQQLILYFIIINLCLLGMQLRKSLLRSKN